MDHAKTTRKSLYTNSDFGFARIPDDASIFRLRMDTWYHDEETLGNMALGDGPIYAYPGVGQFLASQLGILSNAFKQILELQRVRVGFRYQPTGVMGSGQWFPPPAVSEDFVQIEQAIQQFPYLITSMLVEYDLLATIRDEQGILVDTWLPTAGWLTYSCHYTDEHVQENGAAVTYRLIPTVEQGYAPWFVTWHCNYSSIFKQSNREVLNRERERWKKRVASHQMPGANEDDWESRSTVVTLVDPPPGTPSDNESIAEHNLPRFQHALTRWGIEVGSVFTWELTL
jgi:hypothetical protein